MYGSGRHLLLMPSWSDGEYLGVKLVNVFPANSVLSRDAIAGTLAELCRGDVPGRRDPDQITVFKSVGSALADLTAAALVHRCAVGPAAEPDPGP